ncbi:MAG: DUF115 domain-containing protein, partial [Alkalimonas sp.]|nr:DUF115 domain-containing protein [Alkalimonas sp.]
MLKYINYQLDENTAQQEQLEQEIASSINRTFTANMAAFKQYIPSVLDIVNEHQVQQYSVFCNRHGELNAVDFATGRVLYGEHPYQEISDEVDSFCRLAPYFDLNAEPASEQGSWQFEPLPASVDTILVFGLGMGYQLNLLLQQVRVKYIIVYEPSVDYLFCSLQANDWSQLFELAASLGTQVFLQLGNDASSLPSDLSELCEATSQQRFYVYRHYFHPVMDKVIHFVMQHCGQKQTLLQGNQHFDQYKHLYDFIAERNPNVLGNTEPQPGSENNALYEKNMAAIAHFYPQVHQAIQKHSATHWQLVLDNKQQQNLYHSERRALFYQNCAAESEQVIDYFTHHPYKDDVILGQKITRKLKHYLHFSQMQKIQPILSKSLQSKSLLPEQVESLIIFGVALGKHIEVLTQRHQIKNLYICEPNLDFFLASLHVTDWADILHHADENECRIYLNLGGDGSRYFYDLMSQFYQVGAYSIANTYMLSSYYNETMQKAIYDLRAELKVVLAIGEYFDHARYGVAHTYRSLSDGHRFFKHATKQYAHHTALDIPVFVVGNGPSLDQSFDYLKEYQDKAIIISCGTALQALHRHGICPDFHAEIEQNRATYDWISQVQDLSYLKKIRLLSVNGIHPDTAALFKETLLCFKDGEASTYVFQNGLTKQGIQVASLSYAYPTVTNLVVNTMLKLGYRMLYLFGVDLGFSDINYHHSKSSAYYKKDGTEVYNYQKAHGGGLPAAGNFRPQVFTKPE